MDQRDRYRKLADDFDRRVAGVPDGAWERPAPCEGWVARDVVRHLVEWVPPLLLTGVGRPPLDAPSVDEDPLGAWRALDAALEAALADPDLAGSEHEFGQGGRHRYEDAVVMFVAGDLLIHAWDLARATGQDERLDPDEVHAALEAMLPIDDALRASGHYGPRVQVPDDADEQTRLLAFSGRQP